MTLLTYFTLSTATSLAKRLSFHGMKKERMEGASFVLGKLLHVLSNSTLKVCFIFQRDDEETRRKLSLTVF
jgi:hypothetical protein